MSKQTDRNLERLERKIDLIAEHLGVSTTPEGMEEVAALVRENKKVEAVKVYRRLTGAGLKEAVGAVDRMTV